MIGGFKERCGENGGIFESLLPVTTSSQQHGAWINSKVIWNLREIQCKILVLCTFRDIAQRRLVEKNNNKHQRDPPCPQQWHVGLRPKADNNPGLKKVSLNLSSWYNYGRFREEPDLECCKTQHNELDRQPDFCFQSV